MNELFVDLARWSATIAELARLVAFVISWNNKTVLVVDDPLLRVLSVYISILMKD